MQNTESFFIMKTSRILYLLFVFSLSYVCKLNAVHDSQVLDVPWDNGTALSIKVDYEPMWKFIILEKADSSGVFVPLSVFTEGQKEYIDSDVLANIKQVYRISAYTSDRKDSLIVVKSGVATEQWFYMGKLSMLILLVMICTAILYFITLARRGKSLYIRRINGLDSMEEAVGRATEKGKPILFIPGIGDLDDIQTIASLSILSHLAQRSAEYNTDIIVPCKYSMVMSAAREVVKEAYLKVGKPDAYNEKNIFYLTDDQVGYVAGIDGIMLREQPAANFFMGSFFAESLILAETGFSTGAIQTAGTAQAHQLPFFIVSCDYTLIGEELFAASAYLSNDPQQIGSLKGHDFGKVMLIVLIITGIIFELLGLHGFKNFFTVG